MSETQLADRIVSDPEVCGGKPRIKGTRVRVVDILDALAVGETPQDIVESLPYVLLADVQAALKYAANAMGSDVPFAA